MVKKRSVLIVKGQEISVIKFNKEDYISLTDMIKNFGDNTIIKNWLRNRNTIEFLGIWEKIYNPDFNVVEFDLIKNESGTNRFVLSASQWIKKTNAIGIISKAGRYESGTFAHKDIAFEFGSWLSPEFKLYLIKEFQRLKEIESQLDDKKWTVKRELSRINYRIHTDAVQDKLIPPELPQIKQGFIYAEEADVLNVAMFGITAKEWRQTNPDKKGNIRDYATSEQLIVLSNLESLNSIMIRDEISQNERLKKLNDVAITQMNSLVKKNAGRKST